MKSPEEIEQALQRLIPAAMSDQGHATVIDTIDRLASENHAAQDLPLLDRRPRAGKNTRWIWGAAAAVLIGAGLSVFNAPTAVVAPLVVAPESGSSVANSPIFIDRMLLTDAVTIEDTVAAADGSMMNQVNRRIQTRERYRDAKHGYLITISESRDEKVLVPKTSF